LPFTVSKCVSAGRKSHDADAIRLHAIRGCLVADDADGALRVAQFHRVLITGAKPVLEHERRDPHGVEPIRFLHPFMSHGEGLVAPARSDDDRGPRRDPRRGWRVIGEKRPVARRVPERTGNVAVPQRNYLWFSADNPRVLCRH
jgi:hypothetical protein